jgi:hypothetical protein
VSDAPITLFVPFGEGYGNPGLTVRADSVDELNSILDDLSDSQDSTDPESVSKLDALLDGVLTVKAAVTLKFPQKTVVNQNATATSHPQAQATPSSAPSCTHGAMKFKEGVSRSSGNAYKGWFCPAPQGTPGGQCKPQFIK